MADSHVAARVCLDPLGCVLSRAQSACCHTLHANRAAQRSSCAGPADAVALSAPHLHAVVQERVHAVSPPSKPHVATGCETPDLYWTLDTGSLIIRSNKDGKTTSIPSATALPSLSTSYIAHPQGLLAEHRLHSKMRDCLRGDTQVPKSLCTRIIMRYGGRTIADGSSTCSVAAYCRRVPLLLEEVCDEGERSLLWRWRRRRRQQ